jgi:hypothetical protein
MEATMNAPEAAATKPAAPQRPDFNAAITSDQLKSFGEDQWGAMRRIVLATVARSSDELIEGFGPQVAEDDGDTIISVIDQISAYRKHLEAAAELADAAICRLILVGEYIAGDVETDEPEGLPS